MEVPAEEGTAMQRPWGRYELRVFIEHKEAKWGQRADGADKAGPGSPREGFGVFSNDAQKLLEGFQQ